MPTQTRLLDLLVRLQEMHKDDNPVRPEEVCKDCPELIEPLKQQIQALGSLAAFLGTENAVPPTALYASGTESAQTASKSFVPRRDLVLPGTEVGVNKAAPTPQHGLLHWRLRLLCILGVGGWPLVYAVLFGGLDPVFQAQNLDYGCGVAILLTALAPLIFGIVLFAKPIVWPGFLRLVEFGLMGLCILCLVWMRVTTMNASLASLGGQMEVAPMYAAAFNNLVLLCVVTAFGVVVPNPWKQTLASVVIIMAATFGAEAFVWAAYLPTGAAYLPSSVIISTLTLFIGAGVSVFGSYRIERLQGQVREAQRLLREFGQYKLVRKLGGGGMGEVHLAEHRLLKRPCAVKFIRPELAADARSVSRFDREVKAMTRLTHWNIVEIYDYGRLEDGTFYYVMEYVPGMNLDELVRHFGPMPPARTIHVLRQICAGLREAHSVGLIHRDIKPSNIILSERGGVSDTVKLLDFGLVQNQVLDDAEERVTQAGSVIGTPAFMSPEQALGSERLTGQTDLYSLGAVGYFLLTGQPPFLRPSRIQTIHAHIADPVTPPSTLCSEVSPDLEAVILSCLEKNPTTRYRDADSLDRALEECSQAEAWTQNDARAWWERSESR